jgi:diguanylate cyclase (GGDEF)-like protein
MRILLVDPSRVGLKVMSRLLEGRGHTVLPFQDGAAALQCLVADKDIDVVLSSFELAGLSGLELCWEARALSTSEQRPIYVIAMSSSHDQDKLVEALDSGADDFVLKPPHEQELSARLRAAERINKAQRELIRMATRDPLTGLLNRRAFFEKANRIAETASPAHPVGTLMFDIDYFKRVNDGFGHDIGDLVIQTVAHLGMSMPGIVGRLGGEEFACVLDGYDELETRRLAESLRHSAARQKVDTGTVLVSVTISIGVAVTRKAEPIDFALKRADVALYQAKSGGRNRVIVDGYNTTHASMPREEAHIRSAAR